MTTDLEKQFFEVFNIPKIYRTAINIGDLDYNCVEITAPTLEQLYEDAQIDFDIPAEFEEFKNNTDLWEHDYPQITDHHYLLMLAYLTCCDDQEFGIDETLLKEKILKDIMLEYEYENTAKEKGWDSFDGFRTKNFIQALFKEER